jgi:hypothetical protein
VLEELQALALPAILPRKRLTEGWLREERLRQEAASGASSVLEPPPEALRPLAHSIATPPRAALVKGGGAAERSEGTLDPGEHGGTPPRARGPGAVVPGIMRCVFSSQDAFLAHGMWQCWRGLPGAPRVRRAAGRPGRAPRTATGVGL